MLRQGTLAAVLLLGSLPVEAKLNPLRGLKEGQLRADVLVVLDTSGSMSSGVCPTCTSQCSNVSGSDCHGDRATTVDLCGDGMCTGAESPTSCSADCTLTDNSSPPTGSAAPAGQAPACDASYVSRLAMVKRALRQALGGLRTAANVGLVAFEQTGYYTYSAASPALPSKPVGVLLSEWELKTLGGWDTTNDQPLNGFAWPATSGTGAAMALISAGPLGVATDSLYRRTDDPGTEKRLAWTVAGRTYEDSDGQWAYVGSFYSYDQSAIDFASPARVETGYQGPQFNAAGQTWVYQRFGPATCVDSEQGIDGNFDTARLVQGLSESAVQADYDLALGRLSGHLNAATNGGLFAAGRTPLGPAIDVAAQHFTARASGVSPFTGIDAAAACRKRLVLVVTSASVINGGDPAVAAQNLRDLDPANPIRTFVIGLPGADATLVNGIAAAGGTGAAHTVDDEQSLVNALRDTIFAELQSSHATTAAGTGTEATSTVQDNLALLASTEFPGWTGTLHAVDVTTKCSGATPPPNLPCVRGTCVGGRCQIWEAGAQLAARDWRTRRIFTGMHTANSGLAIRVISNDGTGTPCLSGGGGAGCAGTVGLNGIWSAVTGTAPPADLGAMIKWLAGNGRNWKLPAILNSVPATVGPPPLYAGAVPGHDELEARQAARQRLTYVASSEGLLHAFDLQDGDEEFAFLPPHVLPQAYALYKQGGQDADPANFQWVLANSPRVEDLKDSSGLWQTYLVLPAGPGNDQFVVLDITDPSFCSDPLDSATCTVNSPPVAVGFSSMEAAPPIDSVLGETWSLPALFWTTAETPRAAMGSGYDVTVGQGRYYNLFKTIAQPGWATTAPADIESELLDGSTAAVNDYAVVADTAAIVDPVNARRVIATYQADLAGRITRFNLGERASVATILDNTEQAGPDHPFYFSPAVLYREDLNKVTLAAASGAFQEEDTSWNPTFESRLYLRAEGGGSVDSTVDNVTCDVSQICNGCLGSIPASCVAPSDRALPVSSPMVIRNLAADDQIEAFYVYYDPPANVCSGSQVALGDSWIIRVGSDISGMAQTLIAAKRFQETLITGIAIAGGGSDLVLTQSGRSGARASIETFSGGPVTSIGLSGAPVVESWREVR